MGLLSCRPARSGPAHRGPPEPALCIGVSCSFLFEHCSAFPCFGGLTAMTPPQLGALPSRGCDPPARRSWACVRSESALRLTWAGLRPRLMRSGPDEAPLQSSHRQLHPPHVPAPKALQAPSTASAQIGPCWVPVAGSEGGD